MKSRPDFNIVTARSISSASAPGFCSLAKRSNRPSLNRSGSNFVGSSHTFGLRPIAHVESKMRSPGSTLCPDGIVSASVANRGNMWIGG